MAYSSVRGRRPIERASKISHAEVINNPSVQAYLETCSIPRPADPSSVVPNLFTVPQLANSRINTVIAIDGGYREVPVREEFPAATITFFAFGPLLFGLDDLRRLDAEPFIAPEDMARLKKIERHTLVLPTKNISHHGHSLQRSVREALHSFFVDPAVQDPPLVTALRWLLFHEWETSYGRSWFLPQCPNPGCSRTDIELTSQSPNQFPCTQCGDPIFLVDALRLHERVDEAQGASGILSYVVTSLEQLVLVDLIRSIWRLSPRILRQVLFIKDGPLAFFGQTAPLSRPLRELSSFLSDQYDPGRGKRAALLNVVGLEKSGAFVEHAIQIEHFLSPGTALILTNEYIYRYIVPGDPQSQDPFGRNTYWGGKLIYKALDGNVYVITAPTGEFNPSPRFEDFPNLSDMLSVVADLRCSMYDNALIPVALANKLVSLSEFPSARILENFVHSKVANGHSA